MTDIYKGCANLSDLENNYNSKIKEAKILFENGFYLSSIYLGGYAVEILLKMTIMKKLGIDELPNILKTHDLELLLSISGLKKILLKQSQINEDYNKEFYFINTEVKWSEQIRYKDPQFYSKEKAEKFIEILSKKDGFIKWVETQQ